MDHFIINARPQPFNVEPYAFTLHPYASSIPPILLIGRSFINVSNVYLSSVDANMFSLSTEYINPFYNIKNLSANNIGFSGVDVTQYADFISGQYINLNLPDIFHDSGYFDVIVQNEAGFGILTQDSIVPFVSSWKGAINIQKPCVSGIKVNVNIN